MLKNTNLSVFVLLPLFFAFSLVTVLLLVPGATSRAMTTESATLSAPLQELQNGTYVIVARHSQKALDIPASSTAEGTGLTQYEATTATISSSSWQDNRTAVTQSRSSTADWS